MPAQTVEQDRYTVPAGPKAEREARAARDRLITEIAERRNPRTKATVDQLLERYLDQFDGALLAYAPTSPTSTPCCRPPTLMEVLRGSPEPVPQAHLAVRGPALGRGPRATSTWWRAAPTASPTGVSAPITVVAAQRLQVPDADPEDDRLDETTRRIGWLEMLDRDDTLAWQCMRQIVAWDG